MRWMKRAALALLAMATPVIGQAPKDLNPTLQLAPAPHQAAPAAGARTPTAPAQLTKQDVDAWLDGFVPYALDQGDIAGAVVVVVKDGQVLTQRGFGYADLKTRRPVDPATTLFRPGSTSKLFTWTAVMQLVQAGKLDLDRDINHYLDFRIPPTFGRPITLRNLMTHTGGFEETAKYLVVFDPKQNRPLDVILKRFVPRRIYAPGTMPAYSNYGATLAGYIVQRVSGEPFAEYVQRHIFAPLGMAHATFEQPLPARLAGSMSQGYPQASKEPLGFEIVGMAPAGALSASGGDMAKFMIAHLANGGPLLAPRTAALMHAPANTPIPGMPAMALGFYHEDRDGLNIIGHAGDLNFFHTDLHLFLDKGVGLFMSFNSAGKAGSAHVVRQRLFDGFVERYFPSPPAALPTTTTARAHGAAMVGHYVSSRASDSNFLRLFNLLGGTSVAQNSDGTITVAALLNAAGVPKRWREVRPWQWQEVNGTDRLGALARNGRVAMFAPAGFAPIIEFLPAPASLNAGWMVPALLAALGVMLLTGLSWPIVAMVRRRYGFSTGIAGRALQAHRATRIAAWLFVAVAIGWLLLISQLGGNAAAFDGRLDGWMRFIQLLIILAIAGTMGAIWNAVLVARRPGRHRFATGWGVLVALAAIYLVWFALDVKLLTAGLNF